MNQVDAFSSSWSCHGLMDLHSGEHPFHKDSTRPIQKPNVGELVLDSTS